MARVTGLPRPDAGLGNRALVAEGHATMPARGVYRLARAASFSRSDSDQHGGMGLLDQILPDAV
jgi:hypothetical protein